MIEGLGTRLHPIQMVGMETICELHTLLNFVLQFYIYIVLVPDPKPNPACMAFSIVRVILEVIYMPDEVWG